MKYTPYFYIIQDTKTLKYYGGSSYSKQRVAHPSKLLVEYKTSSYFIQTLINERPNDFVIRKIKTFETEKEATDYETRFLTKVKAMTNGSWYNDNEGFAPPPGRDRKHYNNGEIGIFIPKDETPPNGFFPGRLPYKYPKNRKKCTPEQNALRGRSGKIYINDGKKNSQVYNINDIPEGWVIGRIQKSPSEKQKAANRRWWNNGKNEELSSIKPSEEYVLGRLKGIPRNEKRKPC